MSNTILIVDDNEVNVDVLVHLLSDYDLITVLDAKSAFEIVENECIDLILLDVMMPEIDGYEACQILKKSTKTKDIPIIFLSAKNSNEDITNGFELGAVDYVTKPFNSNELLARVNTHLELSQYQKYLQIRVDQEMAKNRAKEHLLYQQSKLVSLGEILMHISHQWKQPLAELGSINTLMKAKINSGIEVTKDDCMDSCNSSENIISFMSRTIDTFENFYKPNHNEESFYIMDCVNQVLSLVDATLDFENIQVCIDSHEDEKVHLNMNELAQVIFSIFNNARDIFHKREIKKPRLWIVVENRKLSISDSGGGVEKELLENIFSPFVSSTQNSGIGLYLSKNIIEKNNGVITAINTEDGAKFLIEFLTWID